MIDRQAPAQRSGVLASLNMVADTLKLLPAERDTIAALERRGLVDAWRHGWLFLTSTPETRPRLVPLTSLWLDTLVLRLMNQGQPRPHPTWFVLDELASLQRLPQLHTAITENRKSNNPVVLGFQGRSQLETRYGHDAEAMLSQPATKIFLRTSEPHAAKWIAETLGDVEIERLRESRSNARRRATELRARAPGRAAGDAERNQRPRAAAGLPKLGNLVVRLSFPFIHLPGKAPAFVERVRPALSTRGPTPVAAGVEAAVSASGTAEADCPLALAATERGPAHGALLSGRRTPMLTISKPLSAAQVRTYHAEEFSNARQNYYTQGRRDSRAVARPACRAWGLSGDVPGDAHASAGRRAATRSPASTSSSTKRRGRVHHERGEARSQTHGASRRVGRDVLRARRACRSRRWSAATPAWPRRIARASRVALDETERYVQARIGPQSSRPRRPAQWVAASFEHDSARPGRRVRRAAAAHPRRCSSISRERRTARPARSSRRSCTGPAVCDGRLPIGARPRAWTAWATKSSAEPVGSPRSAAIRRSTWTRPVPAANRFRTTSRRAQRSGAGAAQIAAHQTREAKGEHSHDEMQRRHRALAEAFGDQPARVVATRAEPDAHDGEHRPSR